MRRSPRPVTSKIDVTTPSRSGHGGPATVDLHRTRGLAPHEVTTRRAIPVTSLNRTIIDLADDPRTHLRAVLHQAEINRELDLTSLTAAVHNANAAAD